MKPVALGHWVSGQRQRSKFQTETVWSKVKFLSVTCPKQKVHISSELVSVTEQVRHKLWEVHWVLCFLQASGIGLK